MAEALPRFVYHPDPIATGSVVTSDATCECCGRARGFVYDGPIYCEDEVQALCPWCIADGSAHEKLRVELTDREGIGDGAEVPDDVADTVAYRTPGFRGWQQERWHVCCGDAAAFLGAAGKAELQAFGDSAIEAIRAETGLDGDRWRAYVDALSKERGPTAYVFRCLHCGELGGYIDNH